jgi:DMSO/TMAO reductase YedYZ molybdopterin-dependent catalytic subunit
MPVAPRFFALLLLLPAILMSTSSTAADSSPSGLSVVGLNGAEIRITADQWAALPHESVDVVDHGGSQVHFEGVPAREILNLAGAPLGKDLRGANLAVFVVAEAADGYRVVYALTEFDSEFRDLTILVADKRDGKALGAEEGPLRIVVPGEKRQGRWTRQLVVLRIGKVQ